MAGATRALQRRQNVNRVEDVAEDDVVEGLVQMQVFRVGGEKAKLRIITLRYLDQPLADFDSHSVGRLNRGQQMPGLAANFQHALSRLNDESQQALEAVVEVTVRPNPAVAIGSMFILP